MMFSTIITATKHHWSARRWKSSHFNRWIIWHSYCTQSICWFRNILEVVEERREEGRGRERESQPINIEQTSMHGFFAQIHKGGKSKLGDIIRANIENLFGMLSIQSHDVLIRLSLTLHNESVLCKIKFRRRLEEEEEEVEETDTADSWVRAATAAEYSWTGSRDMNKECTVLKTCNQKQKSSFSTFSDVISVLDRLKGLCIAFFRMDFDTAFPTQLSISFGKPCSPWVHSASSSLSSWTALCAAEFLSVSLYLSLFCIGTRIMQWTWLIK